MNDTEKPRVDSNLILNSQVAQALAVIGDRWAFLIIRDIYLGVRRFEDLRTRTGAARGTLASRLKSLVEKGILRRRHSEKDRRKVEIRISSKAVEHIQGVEEAILKSFTEIIKKIGPETAQKWCDVLEKVKPVLEQDASNFTRS